MEHKTSKGINVRNLLMQGWITYDRIANLVHDGDSNEIRKCTRKLKYIIKKLRPFLNGERLPRPLAKRDVRDGIHDWEKQMKRPEFM